MSNYAQKLLTIPNNYGHEQFLAAYNQLYKKSSNLMCQFRILSIISVLLQTKFLH